MMKSMTFLLPLVFLLGLNASGMAELAPVQEPGVCLECHSEMEKTLADPNAHTVFKDGECSGCHNPHATEHAGLLGSTKRSLCLTCHDEIGRGEEVNHPHQPVVNGDCLACHGPHSTGLANGVLKLMPEACVGCHKGVADWAEKDNLHEPVSDGECLTCHMVHGGTYSGMLEEAMPALCLECHETGTEFDEAHTGYPVGDSNCVACHDPHAGDTKGLLRKNQHEPFATGECTSCHGDLAGSEAFTISENTADSCLECHRSIEVYKGNSFRHNLDTEESCLHCHNPHAANGESLLLGDQEVLCMKCHFNDSEDKSSQLTHPGVDCSMCHQAHGGEDPQLLATRGVELCAECHEAAHKISHPVGEEIIDPRTGESVNCLSCHQMHGARFEDYLPLSPEMDLCIQCHIK